MELFRASQMRAADAAAAAAGVPTADLMRAAGRAVARAVLRHYPGTRLVALLCGPGNNGGDGFVAALALQRLGVEVLVYELEAATDRQEGDAADARRDYLAAGGRAAPLTAATLPELLTRLRPGSDRKPVLVDALLGTGLSRPVTGWLGQLLPALGASGVPVVAVDVPSGLRADHATVAGPHVRADLTVVLGGHKPAGLFYPARAAYGQIELADIGIPAQVLEEASHTRILTPAAVRGALVPLQPAGHKYTAGTVCVVAGSRRYRGAAELACRGAWRGGAGLVTLVADDRYPGGRPETILQPHDWRATAEGSAWPPAGLRERQAAACVIGPGLDPLALPHLGAMLEWAQGAVVLDAAALQPEALAAAAPLLRGKPTVLTPHAGEAARLLAEDEGQLLDDDPLAAAALLAERQGAVVLLKGPTTVIASPSGRLAVSTRGHPAMATGGTGDVLAGLLGALLAPAGAAQQLFERVCLGAWLHGVAGELAARRLGRSLVASDVARRLPDALHLLERP